MPVSASTFDGFREWTTSDRFPDNLRASFIDKEFFVQMSREELETHASVKGEVTRVLLTVNRQRKLGKLYPDGAQVAHKGANLVTQPDAVFFTRESLESGRVRLVPRLGDHGQFTEIEGTPDWVMEVVSDSSVQKDMELLRAAYHRTGISEYWLIDARGDTINFQILGWRKKGYVAAPNKDGWQRSRVFGQSFRLERQRDELGLWEYTLHVQPA
ncbi:MAG: Uma2 family endonuclease [Gemmataceae bacterium]|nr:Uma2 family endonuclease [Gemmataceae bacterium]